MTIPQRALLTVKRKTSPALSSCKIATVERDGCQIAVDHGNLIVIGTELVGEGRTATHQQCFSFFVVADIYQQGRERTLVGSNGKRIRSCRLAKTEPLPRPPHALVCHPSCVREPAEVVIDHGSEICVTSRLRSIQSKSI